MTARTYQPGWLLVLLMATNVAAQGREGRVPIVLREGLVAGEGAASEPDEGVAVRMFEGPTLGRFLRKAQDFLRRGDHTGAIKVVQDVLEGNVSADATKQPQSPKLAPEDDAAHAVFSADRRIYRPVRGLCHELLAGLPVEGLALYREMYEVAADRAYRSARHARDIRRLEAVYNRYFATLSAAKALYDSADLLMHAGRYRAAIQSYRALLDVYPGENRRLIPGMTDLYLNLKIAVCFSRLNESDAASAILRQLQTRYPDRSVRVQGELVPLGSLSSHAVLASNPRGATSPVTEIPAVLRSLDTELIPTWQYRFADPQPYRKASGITRKRIAAASESGPSAAPWYNRHQPGTTVLFDQGRLVFMDHFQLRVHDLGSGLVQLQTTEADRAANPRPGKARSRVPVYDFSAMRVAADGSRYYCVIGPKDQLNLQGLAPVLRNHLAAYDRDTLEPAWSTRDGGDGPYAGVTFLATPTVFGDRLLVPVLVGDSYALQGVEASTGAPLFRVFLHSGGSEFARAPSVPVRVEGATAYVLTNAGTLAAADALTGELRWVRRYERTHPYRPTGLSRQQARSRRPVTMEQTFHHLRLSGFVPSDLVSVDGRVLFGPSDGDAFLCLDAATGEVLWVLSKPTGNNVHVIGHTDDHVFLGGGQTVGGVASGNGLVVCVDIRTGVREWAIDAPGSLGWMGRGLVTADRVVLPGVRCLYSMRTDGQGSWRKTPLPAFSVGTDPPAPPANLFAQGPYLAVGYEGGVEVFASLDALRELAQAAGDPAARAELLVQAGELQAAIDVLGGLIADGERSKGDRKRFARRALGLARDRTLELARDGARDRALALLDRTKQWFTWRDLKLQWQLLRIELFQVLGDNDGVEREQDVLYRIMEGKR